MKHYWPIEGANLYEVIKGETIAIERKDDLNIAFYDYAVKFKESAHILTEYLIADPRIDRLDFYFFPISFLYRHSVELLLKAIAFNYIIDLQARKDFINETFHNFGEILKTISPHIQHLIEEDAYNWITKYFEDINTIDKDSDSFRYPFKICREEKIFAEKTIYFTKTIFEKQTYIDLISFANKFEIVFELLESAYNKKTSIDTSYKNYKPLFIEEGGSYYGQSVVGYEYNKKKYYPFVRAYTESAQYLYNKICEDTNLKEFLFIPMCYMYRNAVEISLKEILFEECNFEYQVALGKMNKRKHSIQGLWNVIKEQVIEHANAPADDNTIKNVEVYIDRLHTTDGSADKFRYPTNSNLDFHFSRKQTFDIDNVSNFFNELLAFLSGANGLMGHQNEILAEIQAEFEAEIQAEFEAEIKAEYVADMMGYY